MRSFQGALKDRKAADSDMAGIVRDLSLLRPSPAQ